MRVEERATVALAANRPALWFTRRYLTTMAPAPSTVLTKGATTLKSSPVSLDGRQPLKPLPCPHVTTAASPATLPGPRLAWAAAYCDRCRPEEGTVTFPVWV